MDFDVVVPRGNKTNQCDCSNENTTLRTIFHLKQQNIIKHSLQNLCVARRCVTNFCGFALHCIRACTYIQMINVASRASPACDIIAGHLTLTVAKTV